MNDLHRPHTTHTHHTHTHTHEHVGGIVEMTIKQDDESELGGFIFMQPSMQAL